MITARLLLNDFRAPRRPRIRAACSPRTHRFRLLGTELRARPERSAGRRAHRRSAIPAPSAWRSSQERYRSVATCATLDELFGRDDVDAVVIATPASTHETLVRASLAGGRHVLVEKPMALNAAGCEALCDLADSAGRVLMVGLYLSLQRRRAQDERGDGAGTVRPALLPARDAHQPRARSVRTSTPRGISRRTTSPFSATCSTNSRSGRRRSAPAC